MKKLYKDEFDKRRRDLLKILGSAGISSTLLRASPLVGGLMYSRMAEAAGGLVDKVVTLYIGNGALPEGWHPASSGGLGQLPPFSKPLEPVKNHIRMIDGITARNPHVGRDLGHGIMEHLLTVDHSQDSFDVNMGRILGGTKRFPYLIGGIHQNFNGSGLGHVSREGSVRLSAETNPFNMFERVFGNGQPPAQTGDRKKYIVDTHFEAVKSLQNKLGAQEKLRLDSHLSAISETQKQIENDTSGGGGGNSCSGASAPGRFALNMSTIREQFYLFTDIYALAMECNLVGSATLFFGDDNAELSFPGMTQQTPYSSTPEPYPATMHTSGHDYQFGRKENKCCDQYPQWLIMRAEATKLQSYMIKKFADKGLFDSTIMMHISDAGHGDEHKPQRAPIVIAGGNGVGNGTSQKANGTLFDVYHSVAAKLGADQNSRYVKYGNSTLF